MVSSLVKKVRAFGAAVSSFCEPCGRVNYGRFERFVSLPKGTDPDSIKASYRNGVLEVTMKARSEMTAKKVPITVH